MTRWDVLATLEDLKDTLKFESVEGISESTIEDVLYALDNVIATIKNDET